MAQKNDIVIEHYVPRVLSTVCISLEFITSGGFRDLLVINCGDKLEEIEKKLKENAKEYAINQIFRIDEILDIIKTSEFSENLESSIILTKSDVELEIFSEIYDDIHFLQSLDDDCFQWIATKGDIINLLDRDRLIKYVSEEDVCDIFKNNDVNLICGDAGTGKSVLLEALKKYIPRDYRAVKIDFRECSRVFEAFNEHQNWEEMFYKIFFEEDEILLLKLQKIYLFFDDLDEIQSIHVETAMKFIEALVSRGFKIWISSRLGLQDFLESRFNVYALNIQEFSEDVQRSYIKNRLSPFCDTAKIQEIIENTKVFNNSEILGIPLQLAMLTEILLQDNGKLNEKIFVATEMFEEFFKGKLQSNYEKFRLYLEIAALKSCIDASFYKTLNITESEEYKNFIENGSSKLGIIRKITEDGVPVFRHKTYAEYFVACYFANNYQTINLNKLLLETGYKSIRLMFDMKLAEDSWPHLAVIYKDLDRLKRLEDGINCEDKGGRTPLHLACCYGEKFTLLNMVGGVIYDNYSSEVINKKNLKLNSKFIKFLRYKKVDVFLKDKVFKWNAIQYSDAVLNLAAINILLQDENIDLIELKNSLEMHLTNYESLIHYATKFSFKNIFKTLQRITFDVYKGLLKPEAENDENIFRKAAENRSLDMLELLLDEEIQSKVSSYYGGTTNCLRKYEKNPLQWACDNNFIKIVKLLVEKTEIDINNGNDRGWTALHCAVHRNNLEIIDFLLDSGANIEARTEDGRTPLYLGKVGAVNLLLTRGALIDTVTEYGETPLHSAIFDEKVLKLLLSKLEQINVVNARNYNGHTALQLAVKYSYLESIKLLLGQEGIDVNSKDNCGNTPLLIAAESFADLKIFELLLKNGADLNAVNNSGDNVIHLAALNNFNSDVFTFAFKSMAIDVNVKNLQGETVLDKAIRRRNDEVVKLLLTREEIDLESKDNDGNTPLLVAVAFSSLEIFKMLLDRGVDLNVVNKSGDSVLHLATHCWDYDMFGFVFKLVSEENGNNNVNVTNVKGETVLHKAIRDRNVKAVKLLLEHREIDLECKDNEGNTALQLAKSSDSEIYQLFCK